MATPEMQSQSLNMTAVEGATSVFTSRPVLKADGTPVDFTVGTWVFGMKCRASNQNPRYAATTLSGAVISGDASGVLTIQLPSGLTFGAPSLSNPMWILASNDAFSTSAGPIVGNLTISPSQANG